jgi:hypothetical protein
MTLTIVSIVREEISQPKKGPGFHMSWSFQLFKLRGGLVVIFVDIGGISNNPWSKIVTCFVSVNIRRVQ